MARLSFDTAGRITLPETLCDMFGLTDWVTVVGMGERFQIWSRDAFQARRGDVLAQIFRRHIDDAACVDDIIGGIKNAAREKPCAVFVGRQLIIGAARDHPRLNFWN